MLSTEFTIEGLGNITEDIERVEARVAAEIAFETEKELRKRTTLWPQRTGFSRDRFRAEDDHAGDVVVTNSASYARAVNETPTYPRGRSNPNFQSLQRTIEKFWNAIVGRALDKAL